MSLRLNNRLNANITHQWNQATRNAAKFAKNTANEAAATATQTARQANGVIDPDAKLKEQVQQKVKDQFAQLANDKTKFHNKMKQIYGDSYDVAKAEKYRQDALQGKFEWLPKIRFVDSADLMDNAGAYDASNNTVYLNRELKGNVAKLAEAYVEEAGHHLDTLINKTDTAGDEGEMFRRILGGEKLSQKQINQIRSENDKRTITVDGRKVEVEFIFGKIFKGIKKAVKKVGGAVKKVAKGVANVAKKVVGGIGKVAKKVVGGVVNVGKKIVGGVVNVAKKIGNGIKKVAGKVWNGIKNVGKGIWNAAKTFGQGVWSTIKNVGSTIVGTAKSFISNLAKGKIGAAFGALLQGAIKVGFNAPVSMLNHIREAGENLITSATHLLPGGKFLREKVLPRVFDVARTLQNGVTNTISGAAHNLVEAGATFVDGIGKVVTGDFKGGFKDMGMAFVKGFVQTPADAILMAGGKLVSAVQTAIGVEAPGRKLTPDEIATLRKVYGDSIDYSQVRIKEGDAGLFSNTDRAFVHGNTIYMKNNKIDDHLLIHEMGHVWQHQNSGTDYMSEALWAQEYGDAYQWETGIDEGKRFNELDPEQQAEMIADAYQKGYITSNDPNKRFIVDGKDYTEQIEEALAMVRNGEATV